MQSREQALQSKGQALQSREQASQSKEQALQSKERAAQYKELPGDRIFQAKQRKPNWFARGESGQKESFPEG